MNKTLVFFIEIIKLILFDKHQLQLASLVTMEEELDFELELNSQDEKQLINNCDNLELASTKKRIRRKSKDIPKDRAVCGCGNTYSCSSALSIHIKNKHNGQPPSGSIGYTKPGKRRRQPKNKQISELSHNQSSSYEDKSIIYNKNRDNSSNADEGGFHDNISKFSPRDNYDNTSTYNDMDSQYNENSMFPEQGRIDELRRKARGSNGRQYVSKRIYMCGCLQSFGFVEQLAIHIDKDHQAKIPDGSIYGIKKQALMKFFHIPYTRPQANPNRRIYLFKCGCGRQYSCSSSLYYHIKTVHKGSQPIGTIVGVPKNRQ